MIGILDLSIGNLKSVYNSVYICGYDVKIIKNINELDDITHLIIPGVGSFCVAMRHLVDSGILKPLEDYVLSKRPVLGICLGMQILATIGDEGAINTPGLNIIPGEIKKFDLCKLPVPHVGWNTLHTIKKHPVLEGIKDQRDFYFVHSYYFSCLKEEYVLGTTNYGQEFSAVVGCQNILGFQFHPEKSQKNGLLLLENFCKWDGVF
jgi:imidazole glycerol-phosphate synthase subunit HisH